MATVDVAKRSPASLAASRALDAEIEASLAGSPQYPDGTVFVPEELAEKLRLKEYRDAGSPVAVVFEGGHVDLRRPRQVSPETLVIGGVLIGVLVAWAITRRGVSLHTHAG